MKVKDILNPIGALVILGAYVWIFISIDIKQLLKAGAIFLAITTIVVTGDAIITNWSKWMNKKIF